MKYLKLFELNTSTYQNAFVKSKDVKFLTDDLKEYYKDPQNLEDLLNSDSFLDIRLKIPEEDLECDVVNLYPESIEEANDTVEIAKKYGIDIELDYYDENNSEYIPEYFINPPEDDNAIHSEENSIFLGSGIITFNSNNITELVDKLCLSAYLLGYSKLFIIATQHRNSITVGNFIP